LRTLTENDLSEFSRSPSIESPCLTALCLDQRLSIDQVDQPGRAGFDSIAAPEALLDIYPDHPCHGLIS
jgi:hypothetical protein